MKDKLIICDIDDVIASYDHLTDGNGWPDEAVDNGTMTKFDVFQNALPNKNMLEILRRLDPTFKNTIFLTARPDVSIRLTEWTKYFLTETCEIPNNFKLVMKPWNKNINKVEYKTSIVKELGLDNILCVFEDNNQISAAYRELGLLTLQPKCQDW